MLCWICFVQGPPFPGLDWHFLCLRGETAVVLRVTGLICFKSEYIHRCGKPALGRLALSVSLFISILSLYILALVANWVFYWALCSKTANANFFSLCRYTIYIHCCRVCWSSCFCYTIYNLSTSTIQQGSLAQTYDSSDEVRFVLGVYSLAWQIFECCSTVHVEPNSLKFECSQTDWWLCIYSRL